MKKKTPTKFGRLLMHQNRIIFGLIILAAFSLINNYDFIIFHSFAEIFTIAIACGIFFIIRNSYRFLENHYFLFLGISFLFVAMFDVVHMLSYEGMDVLKLAEVNNVDLAAQFWVAARFIQAAAFLIAPYFLLRKANLAKVYAVFAIISAVMLTAIYLQWVPTFFLPGTGLTSAKIYAEIAIIGILLIGAYIIYTKRTNLDSSVRQLIVGSILILVLTELAFMMYSAPTGFFNFSGHILKIISFYLIYRAIIVMGLVRPYTTLFRNLKQNEYKLERYAQNLEREKQENDALLESIGDPVVATDTTGRILFSNAAFDALFTSPGKPALGKMIDKVVPLWDKLGKKTSMRTRPIGRVLFAKDHSGVVKNNTNYFTKVNDRTIPLAITATPVIQNNRIIGAIAVHRDISIKKEIDRSRLEFISFASHQLRTPITTINLLSEMLLRGNVGRLPKEAEEFINDILLEARGMTQTVNTFLDVSRIEMGIFPIDPEQKDITKTVDTLVKTIIPQLKQKSISLKKDYPTDIPKTANLDSNVLKIIIENLFSNAIKYTPSGGCITLSISRKDNHLILSVADNGMGIPEPQQKNVFEKMFRADNARKSRGIGVGLYVVKMISEQAGGKIWFKSQTKEPSGTTFFLSFPLAGMKKRKPA